MREPHTGPSGQAGQGMGLRLGKAWGSGWARHGAQAEHGMGLARSSGPGPHAPTLESWAGMGDKVKITAASLLVERERKKSSEGTVPFCAV